MFYTFLRNYKNIFLFFTLNSIVFSLIPQSLYYSYPTPLFTKIETACKEICLDLQAIHFNNDLHIQWIDESDYLLSQFLHLNSSLQLLSNNAEEVQSYLIEDLTYLKDVFDTVESCFMTVYPNCCDDMNVLQEILYDCKKHFSTLFSYNREIIL